MRTALEATRSRGGDGFSLMLYMCYFLLSCVPHSPYVAGMNRTIVYDCSSSCAIVFCVGTRTRRRRQSEQTYDQIRLMPSGGYLGDQGRA